MRLLIKNRKYNRKLIIFSSDFETCLNVLEIVRNIDEETVKNTIEIDTQFVLPQ